SAAACTSSCTRRPSTRSTASTTPTPTPAGPTSRAPSRPSAMNAVAQHTVVLPRPERRRASIEDFEMIERTRRAPGLLEAKWAVDVVFLMASGMRRHARLVDNIPGLSKKVLTATLRRLEHDGLVTRHVYAEIPVRVEYTLTPLGWRLTSS